MRKKTVFSFYFLMLLSALRLLPAQEAAAGVSVDGVMYEQQGSGLGISMMMDVSELKIGRNASVVLTPVLQAADRHLELPSVRLMSRRQYLWFLRNGGNPAAEVYQRHTGTRQVIPYAATVPYEKWMDGAELFLSDSRVSCCRKLIDGSLSLLSLITLTTDEVSSPSVFLPRYAWLKPDISPDRTVKTRSLSGTAYVGFPVNRWEIIEDYQNNMAELAAIRRTLESVKNDKDVEIKTIKLKGYASPESSWSHNAMLAENRTLSLKHYLQLRFGLSPELFVTDYEAEDWAGLRAFVVESRLTNKKEILEIIDSPRSPDNKEYYLKRNYPSEYRVLYRDCYPRLRHTDYQIDYVVRSYTDTDELLRVFREKPENLSLNELYTAAAACEEASSLFDEIWETVLRFYPQDAAACLNVANASISAGNYERARQLLLKAGNGPQAMNARAVLAWFSGDYQTADRLFGQAAALGLAAAIDNKNAISQLINK